MNIKEVVNDPEWQSIRISMLGTWKVNSSKNCQELNKYLGDFSDPLKVRRVYNYLTGSAFRIGLIKAKEITELLINIRNFKNGYEKDRDVI